ncbi:autotransporter outer membrane beta-barrel domain-containing protein [Hoeflea sp. WL0058]|uniref:Autotransporter outer membrane beta-barrel domain-containing protein n=1 Tax=Flavimaribacter sediminis TaxID=2865987 RepID=A0AAE2ZQI7_9HYPH|nr:autotransporter outer membrane beta-barrel domain-containing protein [Flavimaribacter sediminis]MBW8640301.1 autotransporter outer membrane beta-barrel domain-containing protein [Flavimaribacter sediminis]
MIKSKSDLMKAIAAVSIGFAATAVLAMMSSIAWAACTQDGTTVTCVGSDLGPIEYSDDDDVYKIIVEDLTGDVRGSFGTPLSLTGDGTDGTTDGEDGSDGSSATVTFDGANGSESYGITISTGSSVVVTSTGGDGYEGETVSGRHATGGDAGIGGQGRTATFSMSGGFISQSEGDIGIKVSSTGGAGGKGGEAEYTGSSSNDSALYGAAGGIGGNAGIAALALSDLSNLDGSYGVDISGVTTGISVTSTGGEGGKGGESRCNAVYSACSSYSGAGGVGGLARNASVTVIDTDISVTNFSGAGIEVLSMGGDGGKGGLAKAVDELNKVRNSPANGYGEGGAGGDASFATFQITNATVLITDDNAEAIHGVHVSGTGGDGGNGNDSYSNDYGKHPGWGNGGDGGGSSSSEINLTGSKLSVSLSADAAIGIFVSSMGGDGGSEGSKDGDWISVPDTGANGGFGGDAGAVSALMDSTSSISVMMSGTGGSMGALSLLSQGGDGGDGGSGGDYGDGVGGAGGDGDKVTGRLTTVDATTSGVNNYGIYLASLGGDGGTGAANDGVGGAAGTIDVSITSATVTTSGEGSHGIFAFSQGGAGGDSSSGGSGGNADWITLDIGGGKIEVMGDDAYGIAAVSNAGSAGSGDRGNTAGSVTLTVGADVTVTGSNAVGLYAKSTGGSGNGVIDITVDSDTIISALDDATAAISIVSGSNNTLTNDGVIITDDLANSSIYALKASGAALSVVNNGIFSGAVDFATGHTNSFTNSIGGILEVGSTFDVGSDGSLVNNGALSPGGFGSVQETTITGVFTQGSDGTYMVDLNGKSADRLVLKTTNALLDGAVSVNVVSSPSSSGSALIVQSDVGLMEDSGLTVGDTAAMDFSLDHNNGYYVWLDWSVDMTDSVLLGSASNNQSSVAGHLQQVLESGEGGLGEELTTLLKIVDEDDYIDALDTFASQIASDIQLTSLFSAQRFSDALLSCSVRDGVYRFIDEDQCAWMRAGGSGMERSSSSANRPFTQTAWQFEGGGQFALQDDWFIGTGFSIGTQSLSVDDIADSDGHYYQGGVVAKHTMGNTLLSASLTGGYGDFDITRYLYSSDFAQGNETLWTFSGQISASHAFVRGDWYLKPRVDIGFDHVNMNGFTESGAGGASLTINDNAQTYYSIQPSIEIGGEIAAANGVLFRPSVSVGLTQFLGDAAPSTTASFSDTPSGIAPFTIGSEFDKTYFDVTAGFEVLATDRLALSAEGFGQFSDSITSYGGAAKLAVRF